MSYVGFRGSMDCHSRTSVGYEVLRQHYSMHGGHGGTGLSTSEVMLDNIRRLFMSKGRTISEWIQSQQTSAVRWHD